MRPFWIVFLFLTPFFEINAAKVFWIGGNNNWNNPDNWDCNCIPGENDLVVIDSNTVTIEENQKAFAFNVTVQEGASLIIWDTLQIENDSIYGMLLYGHLINYGYLHMIDARSTGISCQGSFTNYGTLKMEKLGDHISLGGTSLGVFQSGIFTAYFDNYGVIDIETYPDKFGIYVIQNNKSVNHPGGKITVTGGSSVGAGLTVGSAGPYQMINEGYITIKDGEISGAGRLTNRGTIIHHHDESAPGGGNFLGVFVNEVGGLYSVKNVSTGVFVFNDTIRNTGTILIDSTGGDAISMSSGSYWSNNGYFEVKRAGRFGVNVCNGCAFQNFEGGTFVVKKTDENAFDMGSGNSSFYNNGYIMIDSIGEAPGSSFGEHGMRSMGTFLNDTLGIIEIKNTRGIGYFKNSGQPSENYGLIKISNSTDHGFKSSGNLPFINQSPGRIEIDSSAKSGLIVTKPGFFGNGSLTNRGAIEIGAQMGTYGIENTNTLINDTTGVIIVQSKMRNTSAFTNYGFLKSRGTLAHVFSGGNGKNEGVIEDYHGLFSGTNFVNNRIIFSPKLSNGCSMGTIPDFCDLGAQTDFTITNVYRDNDTWAGAGIFDSLSNSLALGAGVAGYTPLYVEVQNSIKGNSDTLRIQVETACPVSCPGEPAFWTGCGTTTDWTEAANWSTGAVPGMTDPVLISGAPASGQFPFVDSTQTVGSLLLLPGATMTLSPGQTLNIGN